MIIGGHDYKFAYTIDAYLAVADLHLQNTGKNQQMRSTLHLAVIMNKAYEDREKLNNSRHKVKYLSMDMLKSLDAFDFAQLSKEVDEAYMVGSHISVETEKPKKK